MDNKLENISISDSITHEEAMVELLLESIDKRIFLLTRSFPFVFIGKIIAVHGDYVQVKVDTTPIQELENRLWSIHIHRIEIFYIEEENGPKIPKLINNLS
ncbi:hypothetical protein [Bacillus kwashiorkori]|uniref:hypothetical protein n=1 Tax=Bacillus kwashiorkori TaxID=1522318 RepID=UPI001EF06837|nr:hypothetical protein [Bacillus kwashiorkori]